MESPPAPRPEHLTRSAVRAYLASRQGCSTPPAVRAQLAQLDWEAVGVSGVPSRAQLHYTRRWLEETRLRELRSTLALVREWRKNPLLSA